MKDLSLDLEFINIKGVRFGQKTEIKDGILIINKEELIKETQSACFSSVDFELARPGESVRIIPVKDVIEPRIKVETKEYFPGVLGGYNMIGEGTTRVLKGCGVVTTGQIVCFQEGIIDMSGPGADLSIYSQTNNVVLVAEPISGITPTKHEEAVRLAGLKAALYLAKTSLNVEPDEVKNFNIKPLAEKKLPRVIYVNLVLAQGLLHDNYIYGTDVKKLQTMYMHPNEMLDGAIVSGNCVTSCDKNTTYDHQNNPVVKDMFERHGVDLEFVGVICNPISTILAEKERGVMQTVNLVRQLNADAIVVTEEGGGNPEADLMMICEAAEKFGIKTVIVLHENAGDDGTSESLANSNPAADAVVTAGNNNERVLLPKMDKTIGHLETVNILAGALKNSLQEDGSLYVGLAVIMDASSNLGITKMSAITY